MQGMQVEQTGLALAKKGSLWGHGDSERHRVAMASLEVLLDHPIWNAYLQGAAWQQPTQWWWSDSGSWHSWAPPMWHTWHSWALPFQTGSSTRTDWSQGPAPTVIRVHLTCDLCSAELGVTGSLWSGRVAQPGPRNMRSGREP